MLVFNVFFRRAEVVAREDFVNKGVQSACRQVDGRGSVLVEILMTYDYFQSLGNLHKATSQPQNSSISLYTSS